jgi:hypothetical protein
LTHVQETTYELSNKRCIQTKNTPLCSDVNYLLVYNINATHV